MKVTVVGPLPRSPRGRFHVHRADCPDIRRGEYSRIVWHKFVSMDADSMQQVVESVYPPAEFEWNPADENMWSYYRDELAWFPCVRRLRGRRPSAVEQIAAWLVQQPDYDLATVLVAFSEWLDATYGASFPERLTHDDVVEQFLHDYTQKEV